MARQLWELAELMVGCGGDLWRPTPEGALPIIRALTPAGVESSKQAKARVNWVRAALEQKQALEYSIFYKTRHTCVSALTIAAAISQKYSSTIYEAWR